METVDQLVQGLFSLLLRCGISTVFLFVRKMSHIPTYLFLSRENDDDVIDIGKHDFRSVLLQPMLSYANLPIR